MKAYRLPQSINKKNNSFASQHLGVETISRFIKAYRGNNFLLGDIMNV